MFTLVALSVSVPASSSHAAEISVLTGDTVEVDGCPVRLWGIKAPDPGWMCARAGQGGPCARTSRRVLETLIGDRDLRCLVQANDGDGRIVARCSVDGADLGHLMVLSGWATDTVAESAGYYADQEQAARSEKVGLWKYR